MCPDSSSENNPDGRIRLSIESYKGRWSNQKKMSFDSIVLIKMISACFKETKGLTLNRKKPRAGPGSYGGTLLLMAGWEKEEEEEEGGEGRME